MTIRFIQPWNGYMTGDVATLANEAALIAGGIARNSSEVDGPLFGTAVMAEMNTAGTALVHPVTGEPFLRGEPTSGTWMVIPSIFRLRLTGTGTVTIDSKDSLGNVTSAAIYNVSGATDQIEFSYAGDNAVAIRATLTGTATCEVI